MSFTYLIFATFLLASIVLLIIFSEDPKNKKSQTLSFLKAQRNEQGAKWVEERVSKYGSVFKTSLMGSPTVIIIDDDVLAAKPRTSQAIAGKNNLFDLTGSSYRKPNSRKTRERDTIKVVFMKKLTFNVAYDILFDIKDEFTKERLFNDLSLAFKAIWSLPLNVPGPVFWKGLQARLRIMDRVLPILRKRKEEISAGMVDPKSDVMSCLLVLRDENEEPIDEETIVDDLIVYPWRVAEELIRLIPIVFGSFRKALKNISFGGYDIPKGWRVMWVACGTHMDDNVFERPNEFEPSRYESPLRLIPPFTYVPSGGGLRTCIGNEFERVEMLTVTQSLLVGYEWGNWSRRRPSLANPCLFPPWACRSRSSPSPSKVLLSIKMHVDIICQVSCFCTRVI
ncbi:hypothetical protein ACJRO7_009069 [Eucalyptus globulus]|uniref:Cytochrome P450 n=1 Tax=Eucalyptus globulus TaxID=34317 RepID=A0ABD3IT68_EUCGL